MNDNMSNQFLIAHLCQRPPYLPGSVNRQIAKLMGQLPEFRHAYIAERQGSPPPEAETDRSLILHSRRELTLRQKLFLRLPWRLREWLSGGLGGRNQLAYIWQTALTLARIRPRVVVAYDMPWIAPYLRQGIDWPCRLVLSQHGLSYFSDAPRAVEIYNCKAFDEIHSLTLASYRFDRARQPYYEPSVSVIPNSVDVQRFQPVSAQAKLALREKWKLPPAAKVVLFLSVLRPKKGLHMVVESWREILRRSPDALLWIVGGEDPQYGEHYLPAVRAIVERMGLADSVRFQGAVRPNEAHECYQASDLYVFPTLFVEGLALSLIEAMACGLPCVSSDHLVAREAFPDDVVEFVPDPNLAGAFVGPICDLLSDDNERQKIGKRAVDYIVRRYSPQVVMPLWREFFDRQLALTGYHRSNESEIASPRSFPRETVELEPAHEQCVASQAASGAP